MRYIVVDFYENPFGEVVYIAQSKEDAQIFCNELIEDTDGESILKVYSENGLEWVC